MARKNPLDTLKNVALDGLKAPVTVAGAVVGQVTKVAGVGVDVVTSLLPGGGGKDAPAQKADRAEAPARPVAAPVLAETSAKVGGDPLSPRRPAAKKTPAKKAPAKKAPAKKAPAETVAPAVTAKKAAPAKKAPAKKSAPAPTTSPSVTMPPAAKKAPAKKGPAAKKSPATKKAPAAVNVVRELGLDETPADQPKTPQSDSPVTSIDAHASDTPVDVTPADVAKNVSHQGPSTDS